MALLINQGKQDTSRDNNFDPIIDENVVVVIDKLELNMNLPGNLNVYLHLMTGKYKGRHIKDLVPYEASNEFSWKYRALRNCAGEPYKKDEPATIDIEALLKGKLLSANFNTFDKKDGTKGQNIQYKKVTQEQLDEAFPRITDLEDVEKMLPNVIPTNEEQEKAPQGIENDLLTQATSDDDEWED